MTDMSPEEKVDFIFNILIEQGAIDLIGMSPDGEPVFRVTQKCKDVFPEFYEAHVSDINRIAHELWQMGVVELIIKDEGDRVAFTKNNYERLAEVIDEITEEQAEFLRSIGAPIDY
jgi:hypothetical protein